jgi:hypothetical protein
MAERTGKKPTAGRPGASPFAAGLLLAGILAVLPAGSPSRASSPSSFASRALAGVAVDDAGLALAEVEIRLAPWTAPAGSPAVLATTKTDADGRFAFENLPAGDYRLIAAKGGYALLVGKVSTLARETLQLILRPSGAAGEPGVAPEGRRWAMRLPARDLLEDVDQSVPAVLSQAPDTGARREQAVLVEVAGGTVEDGAGEGVGLSAHLGAWLDLGAAGPFGFDFVRVSDGSSPGVEGTADALRLSWIAPFDTALGSIKAELGGARDERDGQVPGAGPFSSAFDGERLHASSLRAGESGILALVLDAETLSGSETAGWAPATPADPFRAWRASFGVNWSTTRGRHDVEVLAGAQVADTGWTAAAGQLATPLARTAPVAALQAIGATGGTVLLVDRVRAGETVVLAGRMAASTSNGPWGASVGGATAGIRWEFVPGIALRAEGGAALNASGPTRPIYLVGIEGGGRGFAWSIGRSVETGFAPWSGGTQGAAARVVVSQGDASTARWSARGSWVPGYDGWSVEVGFDRFRVEGTLATVLPCDLLLVPVVGDAALAGDQALIAVNWARFGSAMELSWNRLADAGGAGLLVSGAEGWQQGAVRVRQRVLASDAWGATASVLVAYESAQYQGQPAQTVRAALTERSRFSGGLAVQF